MLAYKWLLETDLVTACLSMDVLICCSCMQRKMDPTVFKIGRSQAIKNQWVEMGKQLTRKVNLTKKFLKLYRSEKPLCIIIITPKPSLHGINLSQILSHLDVILKFDTAHRHSMH